MGMQLPPKMVNLNVAEQQHSDWVARWIGKPRGSARLLDFASGSGRHCRLACTNGFQVLAVDRNASLLEKFQGKNTEARVEDLESGRWSFSAERFEVIVVTNFLYRPRLDLLAGLLAPGGRLIYETFARGNGAYGKPSNPTFLLGKDELFTAAGRGQLQVVAFEQGYVATPRQALVQRIVAVMPPYDPETLPLVGSGDGGGGGQVG